MRKAPRGLLGELEHRVLAIFWSHSTPLPVAAVAKQLQRTRGLAYTTVMTIINRLVAKELLVRSKAQPHHYQSNGTPQDFFRSAAETFFGQVQRQFGPVAVACFAEALARTDRRRLKRLLPRWRQR